MKNTITVIVIVILASLLGGLGFIRYKQMKEKQYLKNQNVEKVVPVAVMKIEPTDLAETMTFFGSVKAINQVDIYSKVNGRVEQLLVKDGQSVQPGDELATLEQLTSKAQVEGAEASLNAAQSQLKQVTVNLDSVAKELKRTIELSKAGAISDSRKDQTEAQYNALSAQREAVESQIQQLSSVLEQAKINFNETHIRAAIGGIISQRYVNIGDMVTAQKPVFTIIQTETVKVALSVPETILAKIKVNETPTQIKIDAFPDKIFEGKISYISPTVDPKTRNADIEIEMINKNGQLKPGFFCRVEVVLRQMKNIIAVPKDVLVYQLKGNDIMGYAVFSINNDQAKKRPVQIGIYSRGLVEIKEGLFQGDSVITTVGPHIFDGCKVEIVNNTNR